MSPFGFALSPTSLAKVLISWPDFAHRHPAQKNAPLTYVAAASVVIFSSDDGNYNVREYGFSLSGGLRKQEAAPALLNPGAIKAMPLGYRRSLTSP